MTTNSKTPVYLFIPNLICYFRISLIFVFILCAFRLPMLAFYAYLISALLDAVDGYLARHLNQTSQLGATLDYAIDRASIAALELVLAMIYPHLWMIFAVLLMLDMASHFFQLYYTVFLKVDSHKLKSEKQGRWLQLYYSSRLVLLASCLSHDGFLLAFFIFYWTGKTVFLYLIVFFLPGFLFKIAIHGLQIKTVFQELAKWQE